MILNKIFLLVFICAISLSTLVRPIHTEFTIPMVTFKNDITTLHKLNSEKIIRSLNLLIDTCKVLVNGQIIKKGHMAKVPVINGKCTVTIVGRLDYFHPIFELNFFLRKIGRFIKSHLIFSYEIHQEDLVIVDGHEGHIDISNVIIDLVDKYDLWEGNNGTAEYLTEFSAATRSTKITIIDPEQY